MTDPTNFKELFDKISTDYFPKYTLFRLGVHDSFIYPDVEGLAKRLKWQYKNRL